MRVLIRQDWAGGLDHETNPSKSGVDHPQAKDQRTPDRPGQDRRGGLPCHLGETADISPVETAVRGMQAVEAKRMPQLEEKKASLKKLLAEAEQEKPVHKDLVAL